MHTSHFVANGVVQTAYYEAGDGDVPFILVHGFTGSKLDFCDHLGWFGDARRVVAYDQRGHGESSNVAPFDFYTYANDLFGLLDALEIPRAHVLGHSMGGMVVMRAALAQPERFASLILMDTAPGPLEVFSDEDRERLNRMVLDNGCASLFEHMHGQSQPRHVKRGIDYVGEQEHWRRIRVKLEQMDPQAFVELGGLFNDHPSVLSSLEQIELPTTVIVGAKDKPFMKPSKAMARAIPNARFVKISGAGHSPQYENAEAWREAVDTHLG